MPYHCFNLCLQSFTVCSQAIGVILSILIITLGVITSSDVYYKERLLDQLMSMIQDGHPKAKGTAVLCLSNYFKAGKHTESVILHR